MQPLPDFEDLQKLAQDDPEALERLRQEHVNELIESSPERIKHRLRGIQFQIDSLRRISPCPLAACIKISQMMCDTAVELTEHVDHLRDRPYKTTHQLQPQLQHRENATVLPLRKYKSI